jgi:FMN-dependent NADH-azoreductase
VEGNVAELLNEDEQIIRIQTDSLSMPMLIQLLQTNYQPLQVNEQFVEISLLKENIPALNAQIVAAGLPIFAIEAKRKLEDYFINLLAS